jgi:glycerol-3-phosphate dehydrogenase
MEIRTRQSVIEHYKAHPEVSVLIAGAGVNGIGTFRDLALNDMDVLIVDKNDFCSGASAASSHMLHGGIRYLEYGEFRLVKEALTERNRMLHNAPHHSKPLPTTIPIYSGFSGTFNAPLKFLGLRDKPSERGAFIIKMGLMMYDAFTRGQQGLPGHRIIGREESLKMRPKLNKDIVCTATYFDAWMPYPERICLEMIRDSEAANPSANALNYVSLHASDGTTVTLKDEVTGETFQVKPKTVINAAGPWIDFANKAIGQQTHFIGGTKGSHLIVDHPELHAMLEGHEVFFENKDGRICLIFPMLDKVILGTTDIRFDTPDEAICTEDEIQYMLDLVSFVFPDVKISRDQILFHFCGVRPLESSEASRTGAISRDHSIRTLEAGPGLNFPVFSLIGGKWTTFRAFSEQAADHVMQRLGKQRKVNTTDVPIGGGHNYPHGAEQQIWIDSVARQTGVPAARIRELFDRYGTLAEQIATFIRQDTDSPLATKSDYSRREILYLASTEKVIHLDDLLLRRSLLAMLGFVTGDMLEELASIIGPSMGWSSAQAETEIERARQMLIKRHGVPAQRLQQSALPVN